MTERLSCGAVSEMQNPSTSSRWPNWMLRCLIFRGAVCCSLPMICSLLKKDCVCDFCSLSPSPPPHPRAPRAPFPCHLIGRFAGLGFKQLSWLDAWPMPLSLVIFNNVSVHYKVHTHLELAGCILLDFAGALSRGTGGERGWRGCCSDARHAARDLHVTDLVTLHHSVWL